MKRFLFSKNKTVMLSALFFLAFHCRSDENTIWPVTFSGDTETTKKTGDRTTSEKENITPSGSGEIPVSRKHTDTVEKKESTSVLQKSMTSAMEDGFPAHTPRSRLILPPAVLSPDRQKPGHIQLQDAVELAIKWHPVIKRSERELAQSREYVNEAKSAYYPSLSARIKSGVEDNEYTGHHDHSQALVLSVSQVLYDFDKTQSKVRLANSSSDQQAHNLDKNINDIIYETVNSYLQTIRYLGLVEVAHRQVAGFSAINVLAERRANLGASAQSDYSQSRVRLASSVAQLHDFEAQAERWSSTLNSLTNKNIAPSLNRTFPEGMERVCQSPEISRGVSPAVAMAQVQIEMAKDQVAAAKAEYFPTISLNPGYEYQLYNNDDSSRGRAKKGRWGVFVNVSIPLYEGGAQMSRTHQSEQALYAAQYNLDQEITEARRKLSESMSQIPALGESLQARVVREKEARQTRDLYKLQYTELGNRSFSDLLSAEGEIHQTGMDIINDRFTVSALAVDCLYYSGHLSDYFTGGQGKD